MGIWCILDQADNRQDLIATGLIDDQNRSQDQFFFLQDSLDLARHPVVLATSGGGDDDFHRLYRTPSSLAPRLG